MKRVWTKKMTEKLIELYPTTNDRELVEIFGLNRNRIKDKANKLKIKKLIKKKNWTEEKAEVICKLAQVIVLSAKVEVDFFKASGYDAGLGTGFIQLEMPKDA